MRRALAIVGSVLLVLIVAVVVARATSHPIDGLGCDFTEAGTYHVHAHLAIVVRGRAVTQPPAGVGIHFEHLCLYWLHTHDDTGIIHIEAPRRIMPTLISFFDVWGQPLTSRRIAGFTVRHGETVRSFVGGQRYAGDPRGIVLRQHTAVTLEIGPPFIPPPPVSWHGL